MTQAREVLDRGAQAFVERDLQTLTEVDAENAVLVAPDEPGAKGRCSPPPAG